MQNNTQIRTQPKPNCICCNSTGTYLYKALQDRLFGAQGEWSLKRCNNNQCKLLWLDPTPLSEDLPLAYKNYYTHSKNPVVKKSFFSKLVAGYQAFQYQYLVDQTTFLQRSAGKVISFFSFFKEHMDYPFVYFKHLQKGKLLELGVGSGDTLKIFSNWGWQVEGLDFDPEAVKYATSQGLKVYEGDIFTQNFAGDSFDALFSSHVLEHVPDPVGLMQESLRVLKTGGIFVAVTPNASSKLHRIYKFNWRELDPPRHLHIFTPEALLTAAKKAGFSKIDIVTSNYSAAGVCFISHKISRFGITTMHSYSFFRYFAQCVRLYLNFMHRFSPLSGEELVLIAYK